MSGGGVPSPGRRGRRGQRRLTARGVAGGGRGRAVGRRRAARPAAPIPGTPRPGSGGARAARRADARAMAASLQGLALTVLSSAFFTTCQGFERGTLDPLRLFRLMTSSRYALSGVVTGADAL